MKINRYQQLASNSQKVYAANEKSLLRLKAGDIFKGQIIDIKQGKLSLLLETGATVEAKLQSNVYELKIGQSLFFRVQSLTNEQIFIEILPDQWSDSKSNIILEALEAANLLPTDENYKMVEKLLEKQLPVDKDNLHAINQFIKSNKNVTLDKIIFLMDKQIPVNEKNISQLDGYIEQHIHLHKQIENLLDKIIKLSHSPIAEKILDCFLETGDNALTDKDINPEEIINKADLLDKEAQRVRAGETELKNQLTEIRKEVELLTFMKDNQHIIETFMNQHEFFTEEEFFSFLMSEFPTSEIKALMSNDNHFFMFFAENMKYLLENKTDNQYLEKVLNNKIRTFLNVLKEELYLPLEKLKNKEELKERFNKLYKYMNRLENLLTGQDSAQVKDLYKTCQEIKNNLEFMNQFSKSDAFIQIPIKLNHHHSEAQLYVFRKKKTAKKSSHSLSVLIALDLAYMGHTEVFVQKNDKDLYLQFKLENDTYIKIMKEYIHRLLDVLSYKSYKIRSLNFHKLEDSFNLLKTEENDYNINEEPRRFSFDMRV